MSTFHILITDGLDASAQAVLRSCSVDDRTGIAADELVKIIADYDALIVRGRTKATASLLEAATRLKVIGRAGVGVDNIDLAAAKSRGVTVVNAPVSTTLAVAELTFSLLLALAREIPRADASMKQGQWLKKELEGAELYGKTLGILGMGHIGSEVARRARAFGMNVLGYDPLLTPDEIRGRVAEPVDRDELLARSDFVSLHLPLLPETRGMFNAEQFAKMKDGARVVCAARGGIIDEAALLAAIESGKIAGAALDVFASEPPGATDLVKHPRVIATPHVGAQTAEAQSRAAEDIAHEVLAALRGGKLRWKVA
ncbi:MAG: hydroxyacid dehydrogenase [Anaerolineales bacterium]|nr:MAG: hydroxyacid dehydrogenase [Anaerolineales bacterium]HPP62795.1 hydroxyacid dehydrogenase [Anaerolineales bacterium]